MFILLIVKDNTHHHKIKINLIDNAKKPQGHRSPNSKNTQKEHKSKKLSE